MLEDSGTGVGLGGGVAVFGVGDTVAALTFWLSAEADGASMKVTEKAITAIAKSRPARETLVITIYLPPVSELSAFQIVNPKGP